MKRFAYQALESTIFDACESLSWNLNLNGRLLATVKCLSFISLEIRGSNTTLKLLQRFKYQKWTKTPYQTMSFKEALKITLILSKCLVRCEQLMSVIDTMIHGNYEHVQHASLIVVVYQLNKNVVLFLLHKYTKFCIWCHQLDSVCLVQYYLYTARVVSPTPNVDLILLAIPYK